MAIKIKLKHSATANKAPLPSDLDAGELALNTNAASPAAYLKDSAGNIVKLAGAGAVGATDATTTAKGVVQLADATAVTAGTAGRVVDAAQLKAATDADDWTRTGTTLSPKTAGDVVEVSAGTEALPGLTPVGDPDTGLWAPAADTLALSVKGGEALRIDDQKRVGIGTSSPAGPLHVYNSGVGEQFISSSASALRFVSTGGANYIQSGTATSGSSPADLVFSNVGGLNERARIDSSGRLLVGTSSSTTDDTLVLQGNSAGSTGSAQLWLKRNATLPSGTGIGDINFGKGANTGAKIGVFADANWTDGSSHPSRLVFSTTADGASSPTERFRLNAAGQTIIGGGDQETNGSVTIYPNNAAGAAQMVWARASTTGTSTALNFKNGITQVGTVTYTNTATTYATSSDHRLKENVVPLTGAAARVKQLKPSQFNFKADPTTTVDGFIAHEAQAVVPECVTGTKDAVDADGKPVYQGIDQSKLVPLLTAALQEAIAKIETLEARLTAAGI